MGAPATARRPARRPRPAPRRPALGTAPRPSERRRVHPGPAVVAVTLVVGSLLATAGAQAYLAQGQVRLTRLQDQLATAVTRHRVLEQRVAELEDPTTIVHRAQQLGLVAPGQVGDLAEVPLDRPLPTTGAAGATAASPPTTVVNPAPAGTATPAGSGTSGSTAASTASTATTGGATPSSAGSGR